MSATLDFRVVTLAVNFPGPRAAARLAQLGARVTKVEPPQGDAVAKSFPALYAALHRDVRVLTLNLKNDTARAELDALLGDADLLLTSMRPSALVRLGLGWDDLHRCFPRLCHVAIVGFAPPDDDRAGHDLLYQAHAGLLEPPALPRMLIADSAGAERAVSAALALLLARATKDEAGCATVSLADAATPFADPIRYGATRPGSVLRGGDPCYGLYETRTGWLALAALEADFATTLKRALSTETLDRASLQKFFLTRTAAEWEAWGKRHDVPIAAVADADMNKEN
jgi:alpha-methylacyl-CoA racemase